jgi:hypothetical protein
VVAQHVERAWSAWGTGHRCVLGALEEAWVIAEGGEEREVCFRCHYDGICPNGGIPSVPQWSCGSGSKPAGTGHVTYQNQHHCGFADDEPSSSAFGSYPAGLVRVLCGGGAGEVVGDGSQLHPDAVRSRVVAPHFLPELRQNETFSASNTTTYSPVLILYLHSPIVQSFC